ncbi:hypothetical protein OG806_02080 [Streptomyces sp. NBC_00882]|uniref:hypothetical protein n=1 Tax=Streptomyces TaxID=1883 RepID=UPI003865F715|nr:hypothetical protein OG806_02080 [Streptomyces sp. NBC_00882]WSZ55342.1 hypothetical protein OH824_01655 [Streptomyces canus]
MPRANEPGRAVSSRLWDLLFAFDPDNTELTLADLVRRTPAHRHAIGLPPWRLGTLAPRAETLFSAANAFGPTSQVGGRLPLRCSGGGKVRRRGISSERTAGSAR